MDTLEERPVKHGRHTATGTLDGSGDATLTLPEVPAGFTMYVDRIAVEAAGVTAAGAFVNGTLYIAALEADATAGRAALGLCPPLVLQEREHLVLDLAGGTPAAEVRAVVAYRLCQPLYRPAGPLQVAVVSFDLPPVEA